jgi:hypothetical protein
MSGLRLPAASAQSGATATGAGRKVLLVHRAGALVVALVIAVFGVLGLANGLDFFSTQGERIAGLSSNGLLSLISLATAAVLVGAALAGPRIASDVMIAVGALFLLSALANLAVLNSDYNFLAFRMPNVYFSIGAGLVLLTLGAYGRVSGHLPEDNPYVAPSDGADDEGVEEPDLPPSTAAERRAEKAIRRAEHAVVQHTATPEQQQRVAAMAAARTRTERRRIWMSFDEQRQLSGAPR